MFDLSFATFSQQKLLFGTYCFLPYLAIAQTLWDDFSCLYLRYLIYFFTDQGFDHKKFFILSLGTFLYAHIIFTL